MKFSTDFKNKVHQAIRLLGEANKTIKRGEDASLPVLAYNSAVLGLQQEYGGEWWIFRNKAFADGFECDGYMDSRGGTFNPFKPNLPKKTRLTIDTTKIACAA